MHFACKFFWLGEDSLGCLTTSRAWPYPSLIPVLSTRAPETQTPQRYGVTTRASAVHAGAWEERHEGIVMVESSIESAQSTPSNGSQRPQGLVLQSALAYQHAGRSVLPIAPGCKRPSIVEPTTGEIIDT